MKMERDNSGLLIPAGMVVTKELKGEKDLIPEARRFCREGDCSSPLKCGSCRKSNDVNPKLGDFTECPLDKYKVYNTPDLRTADERLLQEVIVDEKSAQLLCCDCKHATVTQCGFMNFIKRSPDCVDCPVFYIWEDLEIKIMDREIASKEQLIAYLEEKETGILERD